MQKIVAAIRNTLVNFAKQHNRLASAMRASFTTSNTTLCPAQFGVSVFVESWIGNRLAAIAECSILNYANINADLSIAVH